LKLKRVVIESPYAGNVFIKLRNRLYARRCLRDSLRRGEAPIASHILYTLVLRDRIPEERKLGIAAGHAWMSSADIVAVYMDYGVSKGMEEGIAVAVANNVPVIFRRLYDDLSEPPGRVFGRNGS
jgi:hypothetical protein